jgi:hypothetical protein
MMHGQQYIKFTINPLKAELNPICHLLALLGGATIVDVSRLRVNMFTTVMLMIVCFMRNVSKFKAPG